MENLRWRSNHPKFHSFSNSRRNPRTPFPTVYASLACAFPATSEGILSLHSNTEIPNLSVCLGCGGLHSVCVCTHMMITQFAFPNVFTFRLVLQKRFSWCQKFPPCVQFEVNVSTLSALQATSACTTSSTLAAFQEHYGQEHPASNHSELPW